MSSSSKLEKWISKHAMQTRREAKFASITVRHIERGNKIGQIATTIDVPANPDDAWVHDVAAEIMETLSAEAENLGGVQRWALYSYYEGNEKPIDRYMLRIAKESSEEGDEIDSEAPTATGMVSQAMRHTEFFARTATSGYVQQLKTYESMVTKLTAMVDKMLDDKLNSMDLVQKMLDSSAQRQIEVRREETKAKAIEQGFEQLKLLGPVILNRLAGKKVFPEPETGMAMMGKQFFASIASDPKQMEAVMATLTSEQKIAMFELLEIFEASSKAEKEAKTTKEKTAH